MRHFLFWMLGLSLLIVVSYSAEIPELVTTYSPKTGRVIDAATGKGIPGVTVVALGWFSQGGFYASSFGCTFESLGLTDADGYYRTPSGLMHMAPGAPWLGPKNWWTINAVKPGYALVDKSKYNDTVGVDRHGAVVTSRWKVFSVGVSDIVMHKVDASLDERFDDYSVAGGSCELINPALYYRLRNEIFSDLRPMVCALSVDAPLDEKTVWGLHGFSTHLTPDSRSVERFKQRLIALDPAYSQTLNTSHAPHAYRAGDLCTVMTAMGNDK